MALPGLSRADAVDAFTRLFNYGILLPADLATIHSTQRRFLSVAMLRALEEVPTKVGFECYKALSFIPRNELSLYLLRSFVTEFFYRSGRSLDMHRKAFDQWVTVFPETRALVPVLLAGCIAPEYDDELEHAEKVGKIIAPLLWEWRNEPVDEKWLMESDSCTGWANTHGIDVIGRLSKATLKYAHEVWGITAQQHLELQSWCGLMKSRRAQLKTNLKRQRG